MTMQSRQANVYQKTAVYSGTMDADPHSLITQMLDGALTRIAQGKGSMLRKDIKTKAELISKAITIIGSLEGCLDHDVGGELITMVVCLNILHNSPPLLSSLALWVPLSVHFFAPFLATTTLAEYAGA